MVPAQLVPLLAVLEPTKPKPALRSPTEFVLPALLLVLLAPLNLKPVEEVSTVFALLVLSPSLAVLLVLLPLDLSPLTVLLARLACTSPPTSFADVALPLVLLTTTRAELVPPTWIVFALLATLLVLAVLVVRQAAVLFVEQETTSIPKVSVLLVLLNVGLDLMNPGLAEETKIVPVFSVVLQNVLAALLLLVPSVLTATTFLLVNVPQALVSLWLVVSLWTKLLAKIWNSQPLGASALLDPSLSMKILKIKPLTVKIL